MVDAQFYEYVSEMLQKAGHMITSIPVYANHSASETLYIDSNKSNLVHIHKQNKLYHNFHKDQAPPVLIVSPPFYFQKCHEKFHNSGRAVSGKKFFHKYRIYKLFSFSSLLYNYIIT